MTTPQPLPMIDASAVAQRMLTGIVDHFDAQGWDLPDRRYVAAGSPTIIAADDEHLAVCLAAMHSGVTPRSLNATGGVQGRGARSVHTPRADFGVRLMRCVSTIDDSGEPPSADELHADGVRLLTDPGRLLTALYTWLNNDFQAYNPSPMTVLGDVDVIGPMGGLAGHTVKVTIGPVQ